MIPRDPPRRPQLGFLYLPPYRVQGLSVAGEESVVQVPELDVCFDIGRCPKAVLSSAYVALTHGHMDHSAGLAYYFSQRNFQGMGVGTVLCHPTLKKPIENLMNAWVDVEAQRTPFKVIALEPGEEIEIKNNIFLRTFATNHTVPSLGYIVIEKRSKLRPELVGLPQEQIVARKKRGEAITQTHEIPLVCYTGDTRWGDHFENEHVLNAQILITECTFVEPEHRDKAQLGKHLHLDDIVRLLKTSKNEYVVLTHFSRRTHMGVVRKQLDKSLSEEDRKRVLMLMDFRSNRNRYEAQIAQAGEGDVDDEAEQ